jgi:hypothetical protein
MYVTFYDYCSDLYVVYRHIVYKKRSIYKRMMIECLYLSYSVPFCYLGNDKLTFIESHPYCCRYSYLIGVSNGALYIHVYKGFISKIPESTSSFQTPKEQDKDGILDCLNMSLRIIISVYAALGRAEA